MLPTDKLLNSAIFHTKINILMGTLNALKILNDSQCIYCFSWWKKIILKVILMILFIFS